ncbi:hypothetical protein [Streptomyces sp. CC208A]|uniref:hypothetical protein n=1 Tax=Streptomyces sp. CC208A TaxID=3044573 RepID=UPI0024A7DDC1|nr:hypothetical protein [Streptomyces sp. CC208A]
MRLRRPLTLAVPLALASLLAAGCGETSRPADVPVESIPEPAEERTTAGDDEEAQREQAREAVGAAGVGDPEFVESGVERVTDGAHVRAALNQGEAYQVSVACVGTGTVKVVVAARAPRTVSCDGTAAWELVENAPAELPVEITGAAGATGMVAWRIDSARSGADQDTDQGTDENVGQGAGQGGTDLDDDHDDDDKPRRKVRR